MKKFFVLIALVALVGSPAISHAQTGEKKAKTEKTSKKDKKKSCKSKKCCKKSGTYK